MEAINGKTHQQPIVDECMLRMFIRVKLFVDMKFGVDSGSWIDLNTCK